MSADPSAKRRRAWTIVMIVSGTAAFALAYGQAPLYYSNQNQYFLHGLAAAGEGSLREDWLAGTADPTPLFSSLVAGTARLLHPWAFHVYQALLQVAYALAMLGLFSVVAGPSTAVQRWPIFLLGLVLIHSALLRTLSCRIFGLDYPWYAQSGVAGQYVLGAMLQPSVFGVLLVVAIWLFARGQHFAAAICVALAALEHFTYALPGAFLTAGFIAALAIQGRVRRAAALAGLTLAMVSPAALFQWLRFQPTTPASFAQAQAVLVNLRIPHHARVDQWLDLIAGLQIAWVVLGLVLVWRTPLFVVLGVPAALAAAMTIVQVVTGSDALALLFPWRISAVLVPVATTIVLSRLVGIWGTPPGVLETTGSPRGDPHSNYLSALCGTLCALLAGAGLWISIGGFAFGSRDEERELLDHVRGAHKPGETYLIPVRVPDLSKIRGSKSGDFQPVAARKSDQGLIPIDLQRFRLATGAPTFVDFKSIPYKDVDVIEWRDRLKLAEKWYAEIAADKSGSATREMSREGITHVVVPAGPPLDDSDLQLVHAGKHYHVYRLRK